MSKNPATRENPESAVSPLGRFGDYELLEVIGRGGMGTVWRARQFSLGRLVALKLLRAAESASPEDGERFRSEAAAVASLQHPHIVALHDFGEHDGQPWFSMDFIEGQTLAQFIRDQLLSPTRAAELLKIIAEAIAHAHSRGILHRDIKPSNILLDQQGSPCITDFGLAKRFTHSERGTPNSDLTLSGQLLGTPNYAPPEQLAVRSGTLGPHSDVYALGAVLYETLTGRPPFLADTIEATLLQVIDAEPTAPRLLNPAVPVDLETICLKCLEKAPARRYATAQELADELGCFLRGEPILARPVGALGRLGRWCKRKPGWATASALALILLGTAGTLVVIASGRRAEQKRTQAAIAASGLAVPVNMQNATATFSLRGFPISDTIDGNPSSGGWAIYESARTAEEAQPQTAAFETASDIGSPGGSLLTFKLTQNSGRQQTIGRFRFSVTTDDRSTFADGLPSGGDVTANWTALNPASFSAASGISLTKLADGSILASGPATDADTYTITVPTSLTRITGVRLETLLYSTLPLYGPGNHNPDGNFILTELEVNISAASAVFSSTPAGYGDGADAQQVLKFVDTEFLDVNWEQYVLTNGPLVRASKACITEHSATPRAFQRITTLLGGSNVPSEAISIQLNSQAVYSPGNHGAIAFIDYSEDCRVFSTEFNTYGGSTAPALKQNGLLYVANAFFRPARDDHTGQRLPSQWKEIRVSGLRQSDFSLVTGPLTVDVAQHPDFSASAASIVFGYAQRNGHTSSNVVTRQKDTDNWSVAIYSRSPSPGP